MTGGNRPEGITDEHLEYLDNLRESGITNMFGAGSFLMTDLDMSKREASRVLNYWMETFGDDNR